MKREKSLSFLSLCLTLVLLLVCAGCKKNDAADVQKDHLARIRERGTLILSLIHI